MTEPKLVIFDKDGTLTTTISGKTFPEGPTDQKLRPGIYEWLEELEKDGINVAIATNQGGVELGYKPLEEAIQEVAYAVSLFPPGMRESILAMLCPDMKGMSCFRVTVNKVAPKLISYDVDDISGMGKGWRKGQRKEFSDQGGGMLIFSCHFFEVEPAQALMVGDRLDDLNAAHDAKVPFKWAGDDK